MERKHNKFLILGVKSNYYITEEKINRQSNQLTTQKPISSKNYGYLEPELNLDFILLQGNLAPSFPRLNEEGELGLILLQGNLAPPLPPRRDEEEEERGGDERGRDGMRGGAELAPALVF